MLIVIVSKKYIVLKNMINKDVKLLESWDVKISLKKRKDSTWEVLLNDYFWTIIKNEDLWRIKDLLEWEEYTESDLNND